MSHTIQALMSSQTKSQGEGLLKAYNALPADKRNWCAGGNARTAGDMMAECALLNIAIAETINKGIFNGALVENFRGRCLEMAEQNDALMATFQTGFDDVAEAIAGLPDDRMNSVVELPWAPTPMSEIIAMGYWNMGYHEGQVTYIAMMNEAPSA